MRLFLLFVCPLNANSLQIFVGYAKLGYLVDLSMNEHFDIIFYRLVQFLIYLDKSSRLNVSKNTIYKIINKNGVFAFYINIEMYFMP